MVHGLLCVSGIALHYSAKDSGPQYVINMFQVRIVAPWLMSDWIETHVLVAVGFPAFYSCATKTQGTNWVV